MPNLHVRLGDETHAEWTRYCIDNGMTSSELIRGFIESRLKDNRAPTVPRIQRKAQNKTRVNVFLTDSEIEAIRVRQSLNGGSRAAWIIKVIRAALTRQPVFDETETAALVANNAAINAVGVNLNQIARRLNQGGNPELIATGLRVVELEKIIDQNAEQVRSLVELNRQRWDIQA